MGLLSFVKRKTPGKKDVACSFFASNGCDFFGEEEFNKVLRLERRRSERSKKHFFMVLFDMQSPAGRRRNRTLKKIASILSSETRDIDMKGWYREGSTVGLVVTETNGTVPTTLKNKMTEKLAGVLRPEEDAKVTISIHVFPENKKREELINEQLYPDLVDERGERKASLVLKRALDVVGGIAGLIIFAPFFIVIPLLIKVESKGPVLFKQTRVGRLGRTFTFFKFRSMAVNNDPAIHKMFVTNLIKDGHAENGNGGGNGNGNGNGNGRASAKTKELVYKIQDDPRITRFGRFLRKSSLDELPQFLNVIRGEMSLVGPRPPIPYEVEEYDLWHRRRVTEAKPGITGLWQVNGRSSTSFADMVRLDLRYIKEWSLWLDIKIILQTPKSIIAGKGAY
jgi:exopolysaccharide biosynthesis polyprenyl glycosylphosphotransferase